MVFAESKVGGGLLEELGSSESYVAISPMGENMKMLSMQANTKSQAFAVLFSGLTFNVSLMPFFFSLNIALCNCCHSNKIVFA